MSDRATVHLGDCREVLERLAADGLRVDTCITSPPYFGLRDYGVNGQLGAEKTPAEFVANLVEVFRRVRGVLADDGTVWLNLGDSYCSDGGRQSVSGDTERGQMSRAHQTVPGKSPANLVAGLKRKDLIGIPWRVAFALQADGWYLRQDIIWHKPAPCPEPVKDRCTKAHEYVFLLAKSPRYYYDAEAISSPAKTAGRVCVQGPKSLSRGQADGIGQTYSGNANADTVTIAERCNKRSVWSIPTDNFPGAHFAVMPRKLVEPCVLAGSRVGGIVLDPFTGSGTTALVALEHERRFVGVELSPEYHAMAEKRIELALAQGRFDFEGVPA